MDFTLWKPTQHELPASATLFDFSIAASPAMSIGSLMRVMVYNLNLGSNGTELPLGNVSTSGSPNEGLMPCSRLLCLTEIRVYLNSGTYRTLVKTNRKILPVESFANTGMSPMVSQLHFSPLAESNTSWQ